MTDDDWTAGERTAPAPSAALALGLGGLVPFLAAAVMSVAGYESRGLGGADVARGYGVAILAFLGGVEWGAALREARDNWIRYGASVMPALLAWAASFFDVRSGLVVLIAGFLSVHLLDEWMRGQSWLPAWYLRLRRRLTAVVLACLVLSAWMTHAAT